MHEVLVNRLGGLSLPRKSLVRLTDRPDMTLDVYRGRKTTIQQYCFAKVHVRACVRPSGFVQDITPTFMDGFQNYLTPCCP